MITHVKKNSLSISDIKTPYDNEVADNTEQLTEQDQLNLLQESSDFWKEQDKKKQDGQANY